MAKWIKNEYYKKLTYENLFKAHMLARKGKNFREEIIKFNLLCRKLFKTIFYASIYINIICMYKK